MSNAKKVTVINLHTGNECAVPEDAKLTKKVKEFTAWTKKGSAQPK